MFFTWEGPLSELFIILSLEVNFLIILYFLLFLSSLFTPSSLRLISDQVSFFLIFTITSQ